MTTRAIDSMSRKLGTGKGELEGALQSSYAPPTVVGDVSHARGLAGVNIATNVNANAAAVTKKSDGRGPGPRY